MRFLFLFLIIAFNSSAQTLILKDVTIIDVIKGKQTENADIVIRDGKIQKAGIRAGQGVEGEVLNLAGKYVIPGLIDAHVHLANDPKETQTERSKHLSYFLHHGITSIRDAAGDARVLKELQADVRNGKIQGPDIYYAAFLAGPDYFEGNDREKSMVEGFGSDYAPWMQCITPGDDLEQAMQSAKSCGATGIKIYGGFSADFLPALIKAAQKEGLKIWGHATLFPAKPTDMARAGTEVISHAYMLEWESVPQPLEKNIFKNYELYYDIINHDSLNADSFFREIKKHQGIFDPTLYLCMVNGMKWSARLVQQAHEQGIKICAGTDYINDLNRAFPFLFDEIELYVNTCGFSPLDAIRSATIIAAEVVGQEKETGSIEKGKNADLLILNGNPLTDIHQLRNQYLVIQKGKPVRLSDI